MKKEYMPPELEIKTLFLSRDILGDSKPEPTDNPIIDNPIDEEDPFG